MTGDDLSTRARRWTTERLGAGYENAATSLEALLREVANEARADGANEERTLHWTQEHAEVTRLKADCDGYRNGQLQVQATLQTVMESNTKMVAERRPLMEAAVKAGWWGGGILGLNAEASGDVTGPSDDEVADIVDRLLAEEPPDETP